MKSGIGEGGHPADCRPEPDPCEKKDDDKQGPLHNDPVQPEELHRSKERIENRSNDDAEIYVNYYCIEYFEDAQVDREIVTVQICKELDEQEGQHRDCTSC